jgi:outer membrane protein insertion porin family
LQKKWIFASRIKTGNIVELGKSTVVPRTERFYLGGASSVRGYSEQLLGPFVYDRVTGLRQAVGGRFLLLTNLELRVPLLWIIWGELFFDAGNIYKHHNEFKMKSIKTTSGVGIAFITPLGPIRFDYARKHQPEAYEANGEFHMSISFAF